MTSILAVGECMVELAVLPDGTYRRGFAGDVFNTALYLARLGCSVSFGSAVGNDALSDAIISMAIAEGINVAHLARLPGLLPGLYMVDLDPAGERSFLHWRGQSAARSMLHGNSGATLLGAISRYDWIILSGITLSILAPVDRLTLAGALALARRAGAKIAFDINYRANGWESAEVAKEAIEAVLPHVDLFLPGRDDLDALGAFPTDAETVVKQGAQGVLVADLLIPAPTVHAVDTTSAGDSFNAGYIAARIAGSSPEQAAAAGVSLAAIVVGHRGAIIPREATPSLGDLLAGRS